MSAPVQEPTTYRAISRQGFVGRQLERRPKPISSAGSYAWARFQRIADSNISVTSGISTLVTGTAGQDINTDTSIFQINSNQEIQMLVDGLVGIWAQTVWSTYDTTWRGVAVLDVAPSPDVVLVMGGSSNDLSDPANASGIVRVEIGYKLKLAVAQHSGGGQTIYGGGSSRDDTNFLEVQYLGTWQAP